MNFFGRLFSFEGRINRAGYWLSLLAIAVFLATLFIVVRALSLLGIELPEAVTLLLGVVLSILYVVALFATLTKRLHDLNRSGWWVLVVVPLFAIGSMGWESIRDEVFSSLGYGWGAAIHTRLGGDAVLVACLVFLGASRGTRGLNRYGADPLDASDQSVRRV